MMDRRRPRVYALAETAVHVIESTELDCLRIGILERLHLRF